MAAWRYFATRLNGDGTETMLDPDLPLEDVTFQDVLSGDGGLDATIDPAYRRLLNDKGERILQEWSTAIYAEEEGDIRWGGIFYNASENGQVLDLECVGFTGYGRDMPYVGSGYKGVKVDPIDVTRTIWNHIQSFDGGDIGLELDNTDTGGKVKIGTELKQVEFDTQSGPVSFESGPYKLNSYTNHDLMGDVDDLAEETPFDYRLKHSHRTDGTIRHFMQIGYPTLGRRRNDLRFLVGTNVLDPYDVAFNGDEYASGTLVLGAGDGAAMLRVLRELPQRPQGRLRRIAVVEDSSIKSAKRATKRAEAENQWRSRMGDVETVVVKNHSLAPIGSAGVGDEIRLQGEGEWGTLDSWVRILGIETSPADGEYVTYSVARSDRISA